MKKVKKFIAVFTAALAVGTSGMAVSANEVDYAIDDEIILYYENAQSVCSELTINSKKASCQSIVKGKTEVTKIYVEQILQKKSAKRELPPRFTVSCTTHVSCASSGDSAKNIRSFKQTQR